MTEYAEITVTGDTSVRPAMPVAPHSQAAPQEISTARILIVEDDRIMAALVESGLKRAGFRVFHATSGEECLRRLDEINPDLLVIDIGLPVMDGLETCRIVRQARDADVLSILFLSGSEHPEDRLLAYDAGGDDFISKPPNMAEVSRKVEREVARRRARACYAEALRSRGYEVRAAMESLRESNVGLSFTRGTLNCRSLTSLAELATWSLIGYGLRCHVQIRTPISCLTWTRGGEGSPLEAAVFEQTRDMGRLFQFRRRLIVNYDAFSLLVVNMPIEDETECGHIRDVAAIIAEAGNAAVESISVYLDALDRTEKVSVLAAACEDSVVALQQKLEARQIQVRDELSSLVRAIESMYYRLGLSDHQEQIISQTATDSVERVMALLQSSEDFQHEFVDIRDELKKAATYAPKVTEDVSHDDVDLWL